MGFKNGSEIKKILKQLPTEEQQVKLEEIQNLINSTDWSFTPEEKIYHISKEYKTIDPKNKEVELSEIRESYIQRVQMKVMQDFYEKLNVILGSNLQSPPPHVTLYTNGTDKEKAKMGIGINSEEELLQLNPELIQEKQMTNISEEKVLLNKNIAEKSKENDQKRINEIHNEILNLPENMDVKKEVTSFVEKIEDYVDEHAEFMMGYSFEDVVVDVMENLFEKYGVEFDSDVVKSKEKTNYGKDANPDEGVTRGIITLANEDIFEYSSYSDGYGASISSWNKENLEKAIIKLLKKE